MNIRRIREKICCLQDQVVSLGLDPQVGLPPAGSSLNAYQRRICCLEQLANLDEDALDWILRVEEADTQPLGNAVRLAMNRLVVSAKTREVWDEDAQLTVAAGARTIDGALVPLLGSALTNFNFVSGDYTRKGGLKGDGATKYLRGVPGNTYPQNDFSIFGFATEDDTVSGLAFGASTGAVAGRSMCYFNGGGAAKSITITSGTQVWTKPSIIGYSRYFGDSYIIRCGGGNRTVLVSSDGNSVNPIGFFARTSPSSANLFSNGRLLAFGAQYATDLEIWDQILTQYHADLAAAIP